MVGAPISPKAPSFLRLVKIARRSSLQLNVFDDNRDVLAICEKYDLAAINRGPLAMGLLHPDKYSATTQPSVDDVRGVKSPGWMKYFKDGQPSPEFLTSAAAVREILTSGGRTVAQGAVGLAVGHASLRPCPFPGFRTTAQVEENCQALEFGPLAAEQMREIELILARKQAAYPREDEALIIQTGRRLHNARRSAQIRVKNLCLPDNILPFLPHLRQNL